MLKRALAGVVLVLALSAAPARATTYTITIATSGPVSNSSTIVSTPTGISCPGTCSASFSSGAVVSLYEPTVSTIAFVGWSTDNENATTCASNASTCTVSVSAVSSTVTAHFDPTLDLSISGSGLGVVTSTSSISTAPFTCDNSASCANGGVQTYIFPMGTTVWLQESTGTSSAFTGWTGDGGCSTASTCTFTLNGYEAIVATFTASGATYPLTVTLPNGGGRVRSSPAGINCDGTSATVCTATFTASVSVSLSTQAAVGYRFAGWQNGGCSGTTACVVTSTSPLQGLGDRHSPSAFFYETP